MNALEQRIKHLLQSYIYDRISPHEFNELMMLLKLETGDEPLEEALQQRLDEAGIHPDEKNVDWDKMIQRIVKAKQSAPVRRLFYWKRIAVAASIILIAGVAVTLSLSKRGDKQEKEIVAVPNDVKAPETNRAMITLANGRKVYLDEATNGQLAQQGNVNVIKLDDGKIVYSQESGVGSQEMQYNTLSNPRGSKVIDMTLADGSRVWLNAGSSVTYPVAFIGEERKVSITGEAYFDVSHDANKKFIVDANGVTTEVLGTRFNVNSYNDEASIKVTLLEGSIKISNSGRSVIIKPGQQAVLSVVEGSPNSPLGVGGVRTDEVVAWKEGFFHFESADLKTILREFARWYDIEVVYEGNIKNRTFFGIVKRSNSLLKVLEMLKDNNIIFSIEGKKLIVKSG